MVHCRRVVGSTPAIAAERVGPFARLVQVAAAVGTVCAMSACTELPARQPGADESPYYIAASRSPKLALVLSSGSLRGLAHIGVLAALEANGVRPDLIVGSSVGALVGALAASGRTPDELRRLVSNDEFRLGSGLSRISLSGDRPSVHDFVHASVGASRMEDFKIPFAAVATDLQRGCVAVFNAGSAAVAVQASTAVPGIFAPTTIAGRDYVDGGIASPLPVRIARSLGAERIIAVDVTFPPSESRIEGLVDRLFQMGLVMLRTLAAHEGREADVLITPVFPPAAQIKLENRVELVEVGARATLAALPQILALVNGGPPDLHAGPRTVSQQSSLPACH